MERPSLADAVRRIVVALVGGSRPLGFVRGRKPPDDLDVVRRNASDGFLVCCGHEDRELLKALREKLSAARARADVETAVRDVPHLEPLVRRALNLAEKEKRRPEAAVADARDAQGVRTAVDEFLARTDGVPRPLDVVPTPRAPRKVALALSGGGAKGAFTVGVLKVLRQAYGIDHFSVISGTSTGSLIGTLLTTKDWTALVDVYSNVTTRDIVRSNYPAFARIGPEAVLFASAVLGGRGIYDTKALQRTIRHHMDFQEVKKAYDGGKGTLLVYNTVDIGTGKAVTFNNRDHEPEVLEKALLASANQPVLTDPVLIGEGTEHVDGGVREYLPLEAVFRHCDRSKDWPRDGAVARRVAPGDVPIEVDTIVAIATSPIEAEVTPPPREITDILLRTVDLMDTEVGKDDYVGAQRVNALLRMAENAEAHLPHDQVWKGIPDEVEVRLRGKKPIDIVLVAPPRHIRMGMGGLAFLPKEMRAAMQLGVDTACGSIALHDAFAGRTTS